jgi:hypothetical protein
MRLTRLALLCIVGVVAAACESDKVTTPSVPPNAQLRFINAVADTGAVDIRFIDQVDLSPQANTLGFRQGTIYGQAEAKSRRLRVFPTSLNLAVTSQVLLDTTISLSANSRVTLLLTGPSRTAGQLKFVIINDDAQAPAAGQIGVRMVNASTGAASGYLVNAVGDALPGTATFANIASFSASPYVTKSTGAAAMRVTDPGSATVNASAAGPNAPTVIAGAFPGAGVQSAGTVFSVYYFPKARAGSVATPGAVWFVDRNPCDAGC